jgi:thymidylate synthase (FAD)
MQIIKPSFIIETLDETPIDGQAVLRFIERVGRTAYKSEDKITDDSAEKFVRALIKRNHFSVIEHYSVTVRIICDRGVSHELVRHRIASYTQESTRYCNYSNDKFGNTITVVIPSFFSYNETYNEKYLRWQDAMMAAESAYFKLLELGASPQEARSVLPNSLKTEIVVTMNLREWRHFFGLRTAPDAHPQMREISVPLLEEFQRTIPIVFEGI